MHTLADWLVLYQSIFIYIFTFDGVAVIEESGFCTGDVSSVFFLLPNKIIIHMNKKHLKKIDNKQSICHVK